MAEMVAMTASALPPQKGAMPTRSGHTATETGADHEHVVIEGGHAPTCSASRSGSDLGKTSM